MHLFRRTSRAGRCRAARLCPSRDQIDNIFCMQKTYAWFGCILVDMGKIKAWPAVMQGKTYDSFGQSEHEFTDNQCNVRHRGTPFT
jgi:hypothetical protein